MRIGVDLDGVLYPFADYFTQYVRRWLTDDEAPSPTTWNFYEEWGWNVKEFQAWMCSAHQNGAIWEENHHEVPADVTRLIDHLAHSGNSIHIVTHRPEYARESTEKWLFWNDIPYHELIFAEDKTKWGLDVLLDDAPHNIAQARAAGIRAITFDQPWNQHVTGERVKSWAGFVAAIKGENHIDWVVTLADNFDVMASPHAHQLHDFTVADLPTYDFTTLPDDITDEEMERIIAIDEYRVYTNPPRAELLDEAKALICGDRNNQYGPPTKDFERTAAMWAAYKGVDFTAHDVAAMMALLKISRIAWSPDKRDHWADLAGYAGCGWECAAETTLTSDDV
jgi:uncharacterized HAD superfamily protein